MKRKKRIDTSKFLLKVLLSLVFTVTVTDIITSFFISDSSILVTLTECAYGMCTIGISFYYWKAKAENLHKYKQDERIGDI